MKLNSAVLCVSCYMAVTDIRCIYVDGLELITQVSALEF